MTRRVQAGEVIDLNALASRGYELEDYRPQHAYPTDRLDLLISIRSLNPLYGSFLAGHLAIADDAERLQALESVLELPANIANLVRVPPRDVLPLDPWPQRASTISCSNLVWQPKKRSPVGDRMMKMTKSPNRNREIDRDASSMNSLFAFSISAINSAGSSIMTSRRPRRGDSKRLGDR